MNSPQAIFLLQSRPFSYSPVVEQKKIRLRYRYTPFRGSGFLGLGVYLFAHNRIFFWLPASLPEGPRGALPGGGCGGFARLRRGTRLASPAALPRFGMRALFAFAHRMAFLFYCSVFVTLII